MNWNKFTKAELISKLKNKTENKKDSNINTQSIWSTIITNLLILKNILLKITLIVTIIKIFKKYRFFRALWLTLNSIVMAIFGISLFDNFGIDFISKFLNEIRFITASIVGYFTNTHFYSVIAGLFSSKEDISNQRKISIKDRSLIEENSWQTKGNKNSIGENKGNSKISEWLNREKEIKEEETDNTPYYTAIILLLLLGICWYYSDEISGFIKPSSGGDPNIGILDRIKNIPSNLYEIPVNLKKWWNRNSSDSTDTNSTVSYFTEDKTKKEKIREIMNTEDINNPANNFPLYKNSNLSEETIKPIELEDKTQIASGSESLIESIQVQTTGLALLSDDNYGNSSVSVMKEIDNYFRYANESGFPKLALQQALYRTIRNRLTTLSNINPTKYQDMIFDNNINEKINNFISHENELFSINNLEEVDQLVTQEQDSWSDRANSPSPVLSPPRQESIEQILSPIQESNEQEIISQILTPIHESNENVMSPDILTYAIEDQQVQDYRRALSPVEQEVLIQSQDFQQTLFNSFRESEERIKELAAGPSEQIVSDTPRTSTQIAEEIISGTSRTAEEIAEEMIAGPTVSNPQPKTELLNRIKSLWKESDDIENQVDSSYVPSSQPIAGPSRLPQIIEDEPRLSAKDKGKNKNIESVVDPNNNESLAETTIKDSTLSVDEAKIEKSPLLSALGLGLNSPIIQTPLQAIKNLFSSTSNQLEDTENLFDSDSIENDDKGVTFEEGTQNLNQTEKLKITKIIKETGTYDSDIVIDKLKEIIPNFNETSYRHSFMRAMDEEISLAKTDEEKKMIIEQITQIDKYELSKLATSSNLSEREIKNAVRENYTHNNLLQEIKLKTSKSSINIDK